jgi:cytidylate kinase
MIIAIDGPSGAGKSTLGTMLAKNLGLLYLDTGAMYRAVGLAVLQNGISFEDAAGIAEITSDAKIELVGEPESLQIFLDGADVSAEIRTTQVGQAASIVSAVSEVRKILVDHQREIGRTAPRGCVLDGRDIGTVVFPQADAKFFLTAKPEARARRRFEEDSAKGRASTYERTLAEINERDERDVSRDDSPLKIADDAIVIDTSELDLSEVYETMMKVVRERRNETV